MSGNTRKVISEEIVEIYDGLTLACLLSQLEQQRADLEARGVSNFYFDITCVYGDDSADYIALRGKRPETDKELAARLNRETLDAERREKSERDTYERLKQKYGGS